MLEDLTPLEFGWHSRAAANCSHPLSWPSHNTNPTTHIYSGSTKHWFRDGGISALCKEGGEYYRTSKPGT